MSYELVVGDCRTELAALPDASVDAVVTDPPYELGFMGKAWDASGVAYDVPMWVEVLRVLKPGGHLLAFGGTRTSHRMVCAIEDAGFEIRDSIHWLYGSGFPKSLNVSKAIDKAAGAERKVVGARPLTGKAKTMRSAFFQPDGTGPGETIKQDVYEFTAPATPEAEQWDGWGTALKPAHEPIVVARKPLVGTVAANVLEHGTGALNIDGCRVGTDGGTAGGTAGPSNGIFGDGLNGDFGKPVDGLGRWPANVIVGHHPDCIQTGSSTETVGSAAGTSGFAVGYELGDKFVGSPVTSSVWKCVDGCPAAGMNAQADGADVARYFYSPKTNKRERAEGMPDGETNNHPTVKPIALMKYLVRLVTPPGGTVLDPFTGSGTTGIAALREGFTFIGVEQSEDYVERITRPRLDAAARGGELGGLFA